MWRKFDDNGYAKIHIPSDRLKKTYFKPLNKASAKVRGVIMLRLV